MSEKHLKEIEVKAKIANVDEVTKKLNELNCHFSDPIEQEDHVYFPHGIGPDDFKHGVNALRIRLEKEKIILTLKQRQEVSLAAIEKEVEVRDEKAMEEILLLMGYYKFITVTKVRRKCHYKKYEICLDVIKDLGNYIEVEKMTDEPSEIVQEELFSFLQSIGIKREDRATRGYDILLYQKLHHNL